MEDCIIVGGGPAGLTAALYLARFLRRVTLIDAGGGRALTIPRTHNLAGFPDGISGTDLLDRMETHAQRYGATLVAGKVTAIVRQDRHFVVTTAARRFSTQSVILAVGVVNHPPPLPRAEHDRGLARGLIRYCPVCDAYEVRGQNVAVLGDAAHGGAEAVFVRDYAATVTLIPPAMPPDNAGVGPGDGIATLTAPMRTLTLTDHGVVVTLVTGETRTFDTLYVALGTKGRSTLAAGLGVHLTEGGFIPVDTQQKTNIDGIYAIGDITEALDQIAVATGQAAIAATAIHNALPKG